MNLSWILISGVVLLPLIYFFVERQKGKKGGISEKRLQVQRKEALDAILKNNKDRYQA